MKTTISQAVKAIEKHGVCLVFPIDNARAPASLWYEFHPKTKMRWEWDSGGDNRVPELWHLREELSRSKKVVYAKWYRGRATFFSLEMFTRFVAALNFSERVIPKVSPASKKLLTILEESSPLSTKELKKRGEFKGKAQEGLYTKSIKALWDRLLIVGFGEIDDGAFPSLAVGSTDNLFETAWDAAKKIDPKANEAALELWGQMNPLFFRYFERLRKQWASATASAIATPSDESSPSTRGKTFVWPGVFKQE